MTIRIEFDSGSLSVTEAAALSVLLHMLQPDLTNVRPLVPGGTGTNPQQPSTPTAPTTATSGGALQTGLTAAQHAPAGGSSSVSDATKTPATNGAASATSNGSSSEPPPPPGHTDRDSEGAEWNAELHSSSKEKNADGRWKKRRGAAKASANASTNEPPAPPNGPPEPPASSTSDPNSLGFGAPLNGLNANDGPAAPPNPSQPHVGQTTQTPATPAAPGHVSGTPALNSDELKQYVTTVIGKVAGLMEAQKMTKADANALAQQCGFGGLAKLMTATSREPVAMFEAMLPE